MSVAIGAAISKKLNNDRNIIYSLHGDGELQEGQNWEAIMFASANKIDNIICTIDYNQKQIDGDLKEVLDLGDIPQKFKSFNWHVIKLLDGNNLKKVEEALISAKKLTGNGKPVAIIMNTIMGNGVDYMMGSHKWHGVAPNNEELKIALDQNPETLKDY
jgi:transketolase